MNGSTLAIDVLRELDVIAGSESPDAADTSYVLSKLNRVLDNWAATWEAAYTDTVVTGTLTPALQPHLIGPTGTWVVTQRPVSIEAINLVIGTARYALTPLDMDKWMGISSPEWTATEPTHFNYRASFPNGSLYLWPVPTSAYTVEIQTRGLLTQLALATTVYLPPGYWDALVLTGSESCAKHFHATPPDRLEAAKARGRIAAANAKTPRLSSDAPGCTTGGKTGGKTGVGMGGTPDWVGF